MVEKDRVHVPLVDAHAHVFRRDLPFIPNAVHSFSRDFTIEDYIAELDSAGVPYAVIAAASFLGHYVDYTLEALAMYKRLRATAIVDPTADISYLRGLDEAGVVGIRLAVGNMPQAPDLRSDEYRKLLRHVADLDWHVHVYSRREQLPPLLAALDEARVKVVVDHFGARDNESGEDSESFRSILHAMRNGRTWVKLSGPYLSEKLDHKRLASLFLKEAGPSRLLWASDWPFVKLDGKLRYQQAVEWLSDWIPDPAIRRQIDANAIALYGFPDA